MSFQAYWQAVSSFFSFRKLTAGAPLRAKDPSLIAKTKTASDAAAVAAHEWLAEEAVGHLETLADTTSEGVAYYFMLSPAFDGFRRTEIGRRLESALMVASMAETITPDQIKGMLAVDISPRFPLAP